MSTAILSKSFKSGGGDTQTTTYTTVKAEQRLLGF